MKKKESIMTQTIENPTITLPQEADTLIKKAFQKRKKVKKLVTLKPKNNKKLDWLNEI